MNKDWDANGLNHVGHSFGTTLTWGTSNPFLMKAVKDKVKYGNCFAYSALWCRQFLKAGRKPGGKGELLAHRHLMIAAQAAQSWIVRQNKKQAFGAEGMFGTRYNEAMANAFNLTAEQVMKEDFNPRLSHNDWLQIATDTPGAYVVTFTFSKGGAHAVAVAYFGQENVFFDPNFGQYSEECASPWGLVGFRGTVASGLNTAYGQILQAYMSRLTVA